MQSTLPCLHVCKQNELKAQIILFELCTEFIDIKLIFQSMDEVAKLSSIKLFRALTLLC